MAAKFEVKKSASGKFMFNLKAANGEVILTSQGYADKKGAVAGVASVRKHSRNVKNFEKKVATNGQPFFTLKALNTQVIGKSELYSSRSGVRNGIASVMRNAPEARIVEVEIL